MLFGLGVLVGTELPWDEKSARAVEGTAFLKDLTSGNASFPWDDDS